MHKYCFDISQHLPNGYTSIVLGKEVKDHPNLENFSGYQIDQENDQICFVFSDQSHDPTKESYLTTILSNHDKAASDLAEEKEKANEIVNNLRYEKFYTDFTYDDSIFNCHESAYITIKEAVEVANMSTIAKILDPLLPDFSMTWILKDDTTKLLKFNDFFQIAIILSNRKTAIWFNAKSHKDAIDALLTIEAVHSYVENNLETGWP